MLRSRFFPALLLAALVAAAAAQEKPLASTPPMGWNSWDAFGFTIDEAEFRANVQVLAGMKQFGWQYAVIDEGWYMQNPFGKNLNERKYLYNNHGLLQPDKKRFPSAGDGEGFKPLADWVHRQGLKFGVHIIRGIPKQVVNENLPIAESGYSAAAAADTAAPCPWDDANYGVQDNAAGQAYYDSMLKQYAEWGLDFIKVDCISNGPYRPTEIRQIAEAIRKTGRPIVLSLSPGPTNLSHAAEVAKYAQMWRISNDHWDSWAFKEKTGEYPFGLSEEFDRIAAWSPYVKPGTWPDPDMLPQGSLTPRPGTGEPRQSRLTHDEERTEFTLWAMSRSPLIYGGNLAKLDEFERALMTNKEALEIDQESVASGPAAMPVNDGVTPPWRAWYARTGGPTPRTYAAVFNLADVEKTLDVAWTSFHVSDAPHAVYDVWNRKHIPGAKALHVDLAPHGCALFRVE